MLRRRRISIATACIVQMFAKGGIKPRLISTLWRAHAEFYINIDNNWLGTHCDHGYRVHRPPPPGTHCTPAHTVLENSLYSTRVDSDQGQSSIFQPLFLSRLSQFAVQHKNISVELSALSYSCFLTCYQAMSWL
jgi:hypothetical protein